MTTNSDRLNGSGMVVTIHCPFAAGDPWLVSLRDRKRETGWVFGKPSRTMEAAISSALDANVPFSERPKLQERDIRRILG